MNFPDPLVRGTLLKRYKRFLADVALTGGGKVTAHCANPGAMLGLVAPGSEVWLSPARNPDRKLKYTWEMVRADGQLVGINTAHPNGLVAEGIVDGTIDELSGYATLRREVRYGKNSRIDILLEDGNRPPCYVEVKNVHLSRTKGFAEFPDSVTKRGAKHLDELGNVVAAGGRAVMLYLIQRSDCARLGFAGDIDPDYVTALAHALARGVEALAYLCEMTTESIRVVRSVPLDLPAPAS